MKLLIYETMHHETLPAILDLSMDYFEKVTVFLTETSYQNLCSRTKPEDNWPGVVFFIQSSKYSNRNFIKEAFALVAKEKYTHFHISTMDHNLLYIALKIFSSRKMNMSLSIQAVNEYCRFKFADFRDLTESIAKLYFHRRIRQYRVFSGSMAAILQKKFPSSTPVFIPSRFFSLPGPGGSRQDEFYKIVIPGSVDPNRRDYDFVWEVLNTLLPGCKKNIELVILGNSSSVYGGHFIDRLKALESPHFRIVYYREYISQAVYERGLSEADIIWAPIHTMTHFRKTAEVYGVSTATGLTADLLLNDTPALVPKDFLIPGHYEDALIPYDSATAFIELLNTFMAEPSQMEYRRKKIRQAFSFFVKGNFTAQFEKIIAS